MRRYPKEFISKEINTGTGLCLSVKECVCRKYNLRQNKNIYNKTPLESHPHAFFVY